MDGGQWHKWCRLCAREDADGNVDVFASNDLSLTGNSLATAIGKYFWVNLRPDDLISQFICVECYALVSSLISFTERVNKVQTMFTILQNTNSSDPVDPYEIRLQYGLLEDDHDTIFQTQYREFGLAKHHHDEADAVIEEELADEVVEEAEDEEGEVEELDMLQDEQFIRISKKVQKDKIVRSDYEKIQRQADHYSEDANFDENDSRVEKLVDEDKEEYKLSDELDDSELMRDLKEALIENSSNATEQLENNSTQDSASQETLDEFLTIGKRRRTRADSASDDNSKRYECSHCPKTYKNPTSFRKHMLEVHETKAAIPDFACMHCGRVCPTENQLNAHIRSHLTLEQKLDIPCPICNRKFTKAAVMRQHIRGFHHNEKPYTCDECGRQLKTLAALNEHKLVHTSETPFECEKCHKRFKNKARLKMHSETHSEIAFVCTQCGLKLNTRRTLKMHMLVHSEEKQYKCDFCESTFKRTKALKNHLILHTGLRPYACPFCKKTFTNGSNCRAHKKKAHPEQLAAEEAIGKKPPPTVIPKIEELKKCPSIIRTPRRIKRNGGGLSPHMRALLIAAESRGKILEDGSESETQEIMEIDEGDYESVVGEVDVDSVEVGEEDVEVSEETVIYEIIDEI